MSEEKEKPDWITRVAAGFVKVFMQFLLAKPDARESATE